VISVTALPFTSSRQSECSTDQRAANVGRQVRGTDRFAVRTGSRYGRVRGTHEFATPSSANMQPRSGGRMQPTAQAVGAGESKDHQAPEGRKNRVPHIRQHLASHDLLDTRATPLIKSDFRAALDLLEISRQLDDSNGPRGRGRGVPLSFEQIAASWAGVPAPHSSV
jgi:hypothetical protein